MVRGDQGGQRIPRLKCHECPYETNSQNELIYHIENNHQQSMIKCEICGQTFKNSEMLVSHIVKSHTGPQRERNVLSNGRWKCYFCGDNFTGNENRDNHRCRKHPYQTVQNNRRKQRISQVPCIHGGQCRFHKAGRCLLSNAPSVQVLPQAEAQNATTGKKDMWCAFRDKCDRRQSCAYKHLDEDRDFLQSMLRRVEM